MTSKDIPAELAALTDAQISKRLKDEFGFNCGPILPTTRNIYLKKLNNFIHPNNKKQQISRQSLPAPFVPSIADLNRQDVEMKEVPTRSGSGRAIGTRRRESSAQPKAEVLDQDSITSTDQDLSTLSDQELARRLKEYNYICGPMLPTTRKMYLKKLRTFIEQGDQLTSQVSSFAKPTSQVPPSPAPSTSTRNKRQSLAEFTKPIIPDEDLVPAKAPRKYTRVVVRDLYYKYLFYTNFNQMHRFFLVLTGRSVGRPSTARSTKAKEPIKSQPLQDFSESETDETANNPQPSISIPTFDFRRGANLVKKSLSNRLSSLNPSLPVISSSSSPKRSSVNMYSGRKSTDQEDTDDVGTFTVSTTRTRSSQSTAPLRSSRMSNFSDSENDDQGYVSRRKAPSSLDDKYSAEIKQRLLRHRVTTRQSDVPPKDSEYSSTPRFTKTSTIVTQVSRPADESGLSDSFSSSYSNTVSKSVLIAIVTFFGIIFSSYIYTSFNYNGTLDNSEITQLEKEFNINFSQLNLPDCLTKEKDNKQSLPKSFCTGSPSSLRPVLSVIREIRNTVDKGIRDHYCVGGQNSLKSDNPYEYDVEQLKQKLDRSFRTQVVNQVRLPENISRPAESELFSSVFSDALHLLSVNSKWELKPTGQNDKFDKLIIEQNYPKNLDFYCKSVLFVQQLSWFFFSVCIFIAIILGCLHLYKNRKAKDEKHQKQVHELVDKCILLLKSKGEAIPVLHIRDTLLNPLERKTSNYRLWNDVVSFIQNNESRVVDAIDNIDGEDFRTWKWIGPVHDIESKTVDRRSLSKSFEQHDLEQNDLISQSTSQANITSTPIKISPSKSPPLVQQNNFIALTNFLKVRNLISPNVNYNNLEAKHQLQQKVLRRIASKSEDGVSHGVCHMDNNDAFLYIKCDSIMSASMAFKALNGWWVEKRVVSVKFLTLDRYDHRFPEAKTCVDPLEIV